MHCSFNAATIVKVGRYYTRFHLAFLSKIVPRPRYIIDGGWVMLGSPSLTLGLFGGGHPSDGRLFAENGARGRI